MKSQTLKRWHASRAVLIQKLAVANAHGTLAASALAEHGSHGSLISGIVRDHFPEAVKAELRRLAHDCATLGDAAWAVRPRGGRSSTYRALRADVSGACNPRYF